MTRMKTAILFCFLCAMLLNGEDPKSRSYVVFYFGATSCGYCDKPELTEAIKAIKEKFALMKKKLPVKFVMVCMDSDIEEGIQFLKRYGFWDEVSIGSHYKNELVMNYLDKTDIPGVPHILVFEDLYDNNKAPIIKERKLVIEKMGVNEIVGWVKNNFK